MILVPGRHAARLVALLCALPLSLQAQRTWHPSITNVSPNVVPAGATITLTGVDLMPPGWEPHLIYRPRYGVIGPTITLTGNATQLRFPAPLPMRDDSIAVEWVKLTPDSAALANPIPTTERRRALPQGIVVEAPPDVTFAGDLVTPDVGTPFALLPVGNGAGILKGKYLRKDGMPTVRFAGGTRQVLQHLYEPSGSLSSLNGSGAGADRLAFSIPAQAATGYVVVEHGLGKDSLLATRAVAPMLSEIVVRDGATTRPLAPAGILYRGETYVLRGQNLSIVAAFNGASSIKRGVARLGSSTVTPSFASDTNLVFAVPASFALGPASVGVQTLVGAAPLGTFEVRQRVTPIGIAGVAPAAVTLLAGRKADFTVTLDIPPDADRQALGSILFSVPAAAQNLIRLPASVAVTRSDVTFQLTVGDVQVATPVTFTVSHESNGVGGQSTATRQVTVTVRPPHPVLIRPGAITVAGGNAQNLKVEFDSATAAPGMVVQLASSDPNAVVVPGSASITKDYAAFTATFPPTTQPRSAVLSATLDGVTVTAPVTVEVPQPQSLALSKTSARANEKFRADAVFSGVLATQSTVQWTASDTVVHRIPPAHPLGELSGNTMQLQYVMGYAVGEPRSADITVSYGGATKSRSIAIEPVSLASFTATPASGPAGTTTTATALLTTPAFPGMRLSFSSADAGVATVTTPTEDMGNSDSKVATIAFQGPFSQPRSVAITASLKVGATIVAQKSLLVTVTP